MASQYRLAPPAGSLKKRQPILSVNVFLLYELFYHVFAPLSSPFRDFLRSASGGSPRAKGFALGSHSLLKKRDQNFSTEKFMGNNGGKFSVAVILRQALGELAASTARTHQRLHREGAVAEGD